MTVDDDDDGDDGMLQEMEKSNSQGGGLTYCQGHRL